MEYYVVILKWSRYMYLDFEDVWIYCCIGKKQITEQKTYYKPFG
jgi:hypothetical protein